jgi:ElaB/YqjD/DUF883 family membrane-anchored ribosome-binding protein
MGQDPPEIREQIEQTRERMGETVDALGYKADVPARAKESITEKAQRVKSKITGTRSQVSNAAPDARQVKQVGSKAVGIVEENPLGLAIGAAAVGFLAGMVIPSSHVENERLGPMADQLKQQLTQTGQEALEHGKQVAQETAHSAVEAARQGAADVTESAQQSTRQHAEELKSQAHEGVGR